MQSVIAEQKRFFPHIIYGLLLCAGITALAKFVELGETALLGKPWIETLVLAILIGAIVRSLWTPDRKFMAGINFCAKTLLEIAVMLLGLSISFHMIAEAGISLFFGIIIVVTTAIIVSYSIGRWLGLGKRMAMLVACGNSICGNSAIAAIAPIIGANGEDIASSIAFTAVLGVIVVLGLPWLMPFLHLDVHQYGVWAGLTVYAVPQVLAATIPVGIIATQIGTLVKLVRVLMLGPVILILSVLVRSWRDGRSELAPALAVEDHLPARFPSLNHLVPWFIIGFIAMASLRSFDLIPTAALEPAKFVTNWLTVVSMAALGLGVDIRTVAKAGGRVTAAVTLSLLFLGFISLVFIHQLTF